MTATIITNKHAGVSDGDNRGSDDDSPMSDGDNHGSDDGNRGSRPRP